MKKSKKVILTILSIIILIGIIIGGFFGYKYYDKKHDKIYYITIYTNSIDMLCNEDKYNYKLNSYCVWYITKKPALDVFIKDKYKKIINFFSNIKTKNA